MGSALPHALCRERGRHDGGRGLSCTVGKWRKVMSCYAFGHAALYILIVLVGALVPIKFLILVLAKNLIHTEACLSTPIPTHTWPLAREGRQSFVRDETPKERDVAPPGPGIDPQQRERSPWAYAPRIQYTPNRWRSQVLYVRLGEGKRNRFLESLDWGHWPPTTIYKEKVLCYPYSTQ